jgi:hypothetical protein
MYRVTTVLFAVLMMTRTAAAQVEPLVHVCTWFDAGERTWRQVSTIPSRSGGLGIGYESADPAIITAQAVEMHQYGMKPLLSWWGAGATYGGDGYLNVWRSVVTGLPAAILYEGGSLLRQDEDGWWTVDSEFNTRRLREDLTHLYTTYWSVQPEQWYRRHGKFVVYLWPAHAMRGDLKTVLDGLPFRDRLYVVGTVYDSLRSPSEELLPMLRGLDAVTGYGFYSKPLMSEYPPDPMTGRVPLTDDLIVRYRHATHLWHEFLTTRLPGVEIILPLELAFDDTNVIPRRNNPTYEATPEQAIKLIADMRQMIDHFWVHCGNVAPIITYVSYNEHFEGTSLEPSDRYGDLWLRLVTEHLMRSPLPSSTCGR